MNKFCPSWEHILGEIYGIIDKNGKRFVTYKYTAFGVPTIEIPNDLTTAELTLAQTIRNLNFYLYKGYVYDQETGLYYCHTRYYNPKVGRWISIDDVSYLDSESIGGMNLYAYCGNNPVLYSDPIGTFPILATLLIISAIVGLGLTIGGVATDNNTMTAIGLTMVAIPSLVSGGLALFGTTGALAHVIGGVTMVAGAGTGVFASAEWQQTFTAHNWMLDAGMSEELYNTLMITTATIATIGTVASNFAYSFNINFIQRVGSLDGTKYKGIRFTQRTNNGGIRTRTLEFHSPHNGHGYHWQLNKWDGIIRKGVARRWKWWMGIL